MVDINMKEADGIDFLLTSLGTLEVELFKKNQFHFDRLRLKLN